MPTTIDWGTKIITVQQADMAQTQFAPPDAIDIYQLNVNDLHLDLRGLEDDDLGMAYRQTHTYKGPTTLSGVTYARLMEIINGYTIEFNPDGSTTPYVVQIVGGNSNIGDVIRPQSGVSVQVANSAGLQDAESLQAASFGGYITIDEANTTGKAVSGTTFPRGTDEAPSNNIEDAMTIARERGLVEMRVIGPLVVDGTNDIEGMTLFCRLVGSSVTMTETAEVGRTAFINLAIFNSTLEERSSFKDCFMFNCFSLRARLRKCGLSQTLTLSGGGTTVLEDCYSGYPLGQNNSTPAAATIDLGGTGQSLRMVGWRGTATITNLTDANEYVEIDADTGTITIDSTVTAGTIRIRGWADVIDNSTGTTVVTVDTEHERLVKVADRIDADQDIITSPGEMIVTKAGTVTELDRYDLDDTDGDTFSPTGTKGIGRRTRQ